MTAPASGRVKDGGSAATAPRRACGASLTRPAAGARSAGMILRLRNNSLGGSYFFFPSGGGGGRLSPTWKPAVWVRIIRCGAGGLGFCGAGADGLLPDPVAPFVLLISEAPVTRAARYQPMATEHLQSGNAVLEAQG